ncbi:MAG: energy transducer TonB [Asticcacaulis sp.]
MASALTPSTRNPLFNTTPQKRLSKPVLTGIAVAGVLHLGLAAYIIQEKFVIKAAPMPDGPPAIEAPFITIEPKKPKPVPQEEVRKTPIKVHNPDVVTEIAPPPLEVTPAPIDTPAPAGPAIPVINGPAEGTAAPTSVAPVGPAYVKAVWSRFPDSAALLEYYPARAMDAEIEGTATLACTVHDTKGRVKCQILSESPKGYGFGDAAVRAVEARGRADTSNGAVEVGSVMRMKMGFSLE